MMTQNNSHIRFRIRIGVTGHRTLRNENLLLEKVNKVLQKEILNLFDAMAKDLFTKTASTPSFAYTLITMLAEGADRLVARAVLDYNECSDIQIVLPLPLSDYKNTFKNPEDIEFDELYQKAKTIISLRKDDIYSENIIRDGYSVLSREERELLFRNEVLKKGGEYIVDNSDILIALWDGKEGRGIGGTKDVIDYARKKKRLIIIIFTDSDRPIEIVQGDGINTEVIKNNRTN